MTQTQQFPERDPSKPAEQQGLFRKFDVRRVDGSDQPGGKHEGCRYYVLDLTHDQHAPAAMRAYAAACRATHPQLASDIEAEFGQATLELPPMDDDLVAILGRPNFMCGGIAERMRQLGHTIKTKSENEQAAVLHLLLGFYLKHGPAEWAEQAANYLEPKNQGEPA